MNLAKDLQRYIVENNLFTKNHQILVAISGGVDSVVLGHLLCELGYNIGVIHCHFGLRAEADKEAEFVENLANTWQVPFYFRQFNTAEFAEKAGVSIQMAARQLRYNFFEQIRKQESYNYIATAHHLNDSLETAIFNFTKGTGIAGLRGILAKNGYIVRPLLFATKQQIREYAQSHHLQWLEDSSNATDDYTRNFIRHQVVPRLEEINPNFLQNFAETAQRLYSVEKVWQEKLQQIAQEYLQVNADIWKLQFSSKVDVVILHHFLEKLGFSFRQCQDIYCSKQVGTEFFSASHWLVRDRTAWVAVPMHYHENELTIWQLQENDILQTLYFTLQSKILEVKHFAIPQNHSQAYFDAQKLEFPLRVRVWREGDIFQPLGMRGKKKISDLLVDCKIPKNLKKRIFVVESGKEIIYVAGLRSSEFAKITENTQKICVLSFNDKIGIIEQS
ncbi:MAG: tRNA lysidine(34) synthetase TilS [Raineya sp.]|nr:tRNA lysidine(34) synthetase TilS [Raineya sp.]MDW8296997.1 tRNA lysidine(34) synthetase TilS [Raineya sp.]